MIDEKSPIKSNSEDTISPEMCYEYASRFLDAAERTELFQMLVDLLYSKPQSNLTPERQVAKILAVSDTIVYEWKRAIKVPNSENTAKILNEITKRGAGYNQRFEILKNKMMDQVFKTYILLLDRESFIKQTVRYSNVRESALKYIPALTTILLYDKGIVIPESLPSYRGYPLPYDVKLKLIEQRLPYLNASILAIRQLVDQAQQIYKDFSESNP